MKQKNIKLVLGFPKKPKTTWVIRTLNEEKWLGKLLEILFLQSRLDFEIIIVDSGSKDRTLEIVGEYPIRKLINIKPSEFNYSRALNIGINESWGEIIGVLSGHSLPTDRYWYERGVSHFNDPQVAAVSGYWTALSDGIYEEKLYDLHQSRSIMVLSQRDPFMSNTNSLIRKDRWKEYPFDESTEGCEDYDWALEMTERGWKVVKDPKFTVYHSHGGLGRPIFMERKDRFNKILNNFDNKLRPSSSFSTVPGLSRQSKVVVNRRYYWWHCLKTKLYGKVVRKHQSMFNEKT